MNGETQMKIRTLAIGAVTALLLAVPTIAEAAWGLTTGTANVRTGPSTAYARITTLPGGAQVWIDGQQSGWYHVVYNGRGRLRLVEPDRHPHGDGAAPLQARNGAAVRLHAEAMVG